MNISYIILYPDFAFNFSYQKPEMDNYQTGSRFFQVESEHKIEVIHDWIANRFQSSYISEITNEIIGH